MIDDNIVPFNPLDKRHLGESVGQAMLRRPVIPLSELKTFIGAGIYAIYYVGEFKGYEIISDRNCDGKFLAPIYVGKAVPPGARKGGDLKNAKTKDLFKRLNEHAVSIKQVNNLELSDFFCRFLTVDDIWIPLGESLLIAKYSPLWNKIVEGFGNHDPGKGRHKGMRPRWDTVHPGRLWAENCEVRPESSEDIIREAKNYLENNPPPMDNSIVTP